MKIPNKKLHAFTLIELTIVAALSAIVITLSYLLLNNAGQLFQRMSKLEANGSNVITFQNRLHKEFLSAEHFSIKGDSLYLYYNTEHFVYFQDDTLLYRYGGIDTSAIEIKQFRFSNTLNYISVQIDYAFEKRNYALLLTKDFGKTGYTANNLLSDNNESIEEEIWE